jgi:hypothetical protein
LQRSILKRSNSKFWFLTYAAVFLKLHKEHDDVGRFSAAAAAAAAAGLSF